MNNKLDEELQNDIKEDGGGEFVIFYLFIGCIITLCIIGYIIIQLMK
jgi:hypothetical protein